MSEYIESVIKVASSDAALEKNPGDPCWDNYIQVGMKEKDGKLVPNCVPQDAAEIDVDDVLYALNKSEAVDEIAPYLITYALTESKNFDAPRAVTYSQIKNVIASANTPADAAVNVLTFIELAHYDVVYEDAEKFLDLLPLGHPKLGSSGLTSSAFREARGLWYAADPSLSEEVRSALVESFTAERGTVEYNFATMKLDALTAAGWKMSFAKRSAMSKALAKIRRRDRKGRFAEEFGRLKGFFSGGPDGKNFTAVGRIVGATDGKNEFQVQYKGHPVIPDGIYRIPADKAESVGAYLPKRIVDKLPKREAQFDPSDNDSTIPLDEFLATRMDSPDGWTAIKNEQGKTTGYQSVDGDKILSISKADPKKAEEIANGTTPAFGVGEGEEFDPSESIYTLKDSDGNVLAYAQDWATAQKANIYTGLDDSPESDKSAAPKGEQRKLDLGEQYGLDKGSAEGSYRAKGMGGDSYEVNRLPDGKWLVETKYDDGNQDEQKFDSDEEAFKYVAGQAGFDPQFDPKVDTPEERPKANFDGVEYGKYTAADVADGYQFGKGSSEDTWVRDDVSWDGNDGVQVSVSKFRDRWAVEVEDRNGRIVDSGEFETPEDAFEWASWNSGSQWDQDWVDSNLSDRQDSLAEKYGLDKSNTDTYRAKGGPGNSYEVYKTPDGKWEVETTFDDGNISNEKFESAEDAFKAVAEDAGFAVEGQRSESSPTPDVSNGDPKPGEFAPKELAAGYSFIGSNDKDGYTSIATTEDGNDVQVQKASNGKWYVTELGGNGPDNYKDIEHGEHDTPEAAFEEASNLLGAPGFDRSAAEEEAESLAEESSSGAAIVKLNSDEDGIPINDMFDVDNAIDEHKETYFPTHISDIESELDYQINRSNDNSAAIGDYMSGGAQARVGENEDGTWDVTLRFPEGDDVSKTFDTQEDAVRFAAEEVAIWNTNNMPSALATSKDFSDLDRELQALQTPDEALTYANRLAEIADALEETRGPKKEIQSLRDLHDLIVDKYGKGDDSKETKFFRMMAEDAPLSSSINPDTNPDGVDAPSVEGTDNTDGKKEVTSSQAAVEKVMGQMLEAIKGGSVPWRKPFTDDPSLAGAAIPRNPSSKRVYTGTNSMVLSWVAGERGYNDGRWMTYKQAQEMGGQVRKGEKGTFILVPRVIKYDKNKDGSPILDANGNPGYKQFVSFTSATVFNVEQIDGLNLKDDSKNVDLQSKTPLEAQQFVIDRYMKSMEALGMSVPKIHYTYVGQYGSHSSSPNWSPMMDVITLPTLEQFNSPEEIFDTLMHELAHSTGHASRLDRSDLTKDYGNPDGVARAKEELIAEISSAILGQMFGIENTLDNSAAYVQSWMKRLKNNPQEVIFATKEAQKVVDYMLGIHLGDWSPVDGYSISKGSVNNG